METPLILPEDEILFGARGFEDLESESVENALSLRLELYNLKDLKQIDKLLKNLEKTLDAGSLEICECVLRVKGVRNGAKEKR